MPTKAQWNRDGDHLAVTFDKPLVDQPLAVGNWVLTLLPPGGGSLNPVTADVMPPNEVELYFGAPVAGSAASIAYLASPPDVQGSPPNGAFVNPFTLPLV